MIYKNQSELTAAFSEWLDTIRSPLQGDEPELVEFRRLFKVYQDALQNSPEGIIGVGAITYAEQKMLEAEARVRTGQEGAEAALQEGVRANVQEVTGGIPEDELQAYLDAHASLSGSTDEQLRTIIRQQYIAHFTQVEGWTDYRRTGYPELSPNEEGENPQNPGGDIPRRFVYPQNESLYNENFPAEKPNLQDRFWWDQ